MQPRNWVEVVTTRRDLLALSGAAAAGLALSRVGFARAQSTPAAIDVSGYPELTVTITDDAVTLSPESIPAGYILMTVVNNSTGTDSGGSSIVGPPADMSADDFLAQAQATPTSEDDSFPAIAYTARILGGPGNIDPGQQGQAILQVPEGTWFVTGPGSQPFASLEVTSGTPTAQAGPSATHTVREVDFKFNLPENITAGPQIWRVANGGTQPHMLILVKLPDGMTLDQLLGIFTGDEGATPTSDSATPVSDEGEPAGFTNAGGVDLQSAATVIYLVLDMEPGTYGAVCFVPDPSNNGIPHAMEGMTSVFQVS